VGVLGRRDPPTFCDRIRHHNEVARVRWKAILQLVSLQCSGMTDDCAVGLVLTLSRAIRGRPVNCRYLRV
jgi:hypothetical protein